MTSTLTSPRHAITTTSPVLQLAGVTVRHPDGTLPDGSPRFHVALADATLSLEAGSFTALVGPSGSGKSTLLSVAAALVVPDEGSVLLAGTDLTTLDDDARTTQRREHIGMVFQQPNLLASLTVVEQLLLPLHLAGAGRRELLAQQPHARELLALVGLSGLDDRRPHQLSGGQRQRVAIARALMGTPRLLLVDEPTSALDSEASVRIVELLVRLTRDLGPATLMVTHDVDLAQRADRRITVRDGQLSA